MKTTGQGARTAGPADSGLKTGHGKAGWLVGLGSLALLAILLTWATVTQISGAVIASGQAVVRGKPKVVQSLDGGVVAEIGVEDGDVVAAGDVLLKLDPSLLRINRDILVNRLAEVVAQRDRLQAEHVGADEIAQSPPIAQLAGLSLDRHHAGQREIFEARRDVRRGRREQLEERVAQFGNQISGVEGQIESAETQIAYVERELAAAKTLNEKGLTRDSQMLELQRREASLLGTLAERQADLARIRNSIRDTELEMLQAEREFREQVATELREVTASYEELVLEIVTIEKQLDRIEILAPADGVIHEMQVYTVGGVVAPESVLMEVVPVAEGVVFEVRVAPTEIDQIYVGQPAKVQFPAFDMKSAPVLYGELSGISASTLEDDVTGQGYYRVTLTLPSEEMERLGPVHLVPGMPVEAFMQTGERSVLSYLTKPFVDQLKLAFRES